MSDKSRALIDGHIVRTERVWRWDQSSQEGAVVAGEWTSRGLARRLGLLSQMWHKDLPTARLDPSIERLVRMIEPFLGTADHRVREKEETNEDLHTDILGIERSHDRWTHQCFQSVFQRFQSVDTISVVRNIGENFQRVLHGNQFRGDLEQRRRLIELSLAPPYLHRIFRVECILDLCRESDPIIRFLQGFRGRLNAILH